MPYYNIDSNSLTTSPYLAGHGGRLEESCGPGPLGHDGGCCQTYGHFSTSIEGRVEIVGVVVDVLPHLRTDEI